MINKENWLQTKKYLEYRINVDQISEGSAKTELTYTRRILEWAGETSFQKAPSIRPTLPEYIRSTRRDNKEGQLSSASIKKTLATARRLFTWLKDNENGYRPVKLTWINSLKAKRLAETPKNTEAVTLDEIFTIASAPAESLVERRIRASAVFWFLSGIRIGAFVTLPIKAVDIDNKIILQDPSLGVHTKNRKYAKTTLLNIPELIKVVSEWDQEVRSILPDNGFWFAPLRPDTQEIDFTNFEIKESRKSLATRQLKDWLLKNNLPYHSAHKFRHGFVHYAMGQAQTVDQYKAISLNVMHSSMEITDQFYSVLNDDQIKDRISSLGENEIKSNSFSEEEIKKLKMLLSSI